MQPTTADEVDHHSAVPEDRAVSEDIGPQDHAFEHGDDSIDFPGHDMDISSPSIEQSLLLDPNHTRGPDASLVTMPSTAASTPKRARSPSRSLSHEEPLPRRPRLNDLSIVALPATLQSTDESTGGTGDIALALGSMKAAQTQFASLMASLDKEPTTARVESSSLIVAQQMHDAASTTLSDAVEAKNAAEKYMAASQTKLAEAKDRAARTQLSIDKAQAVANCAVNLLSVEGQRDMDAAVGRSSDGLDADDIKIFQGISDANEEFSQSFQALQQMAERALQGFEEKLANQTIDQDAASDALREREERLHAAAADIQRASQALAKSSREVEYWTEKEKVRAMLRSMLSKV